MLFELCISFENSYMTIWLNLIKISNDNDIEILKEFCMNVFSL